MDVFLGGKITLCQTKSHTHNLKLTEDRLLGSAAVEATFQIDWIDAPVSAPNAFFLFFFF